jgi:hypothetical protein
LGVGGGEGEAPLSWRGCRVDAAAIDGEAFAVRRLAGRRLWSDCGGPLRGLACGVATSEWWAPMPRCRPTLRATK